jgi:hypothetical protein
MASAFLAEAILPKRVWLLCREELIWKCGEVPHVICALATKGPKKKIHLRHLSRIS